ncbi:hypothetical protein [Streptomyces sp. B3I7]|uniref:hypothetical protein n=1 Tax=Streptomyces sp. B3I7 TaxID=3042269 RepID=UPI00358E7C85
MFSATTRDDKAMYVSLTLTIVLGLSATAVADIVGSGDECCRRPRTPGRRGGGRAAGAHPCRPARGAAGGTGRVGAGGTGGAGQSVGSGTSPPARAERCLDGLPLFGTQEGQRGGEDAVPLLEDVRAQHGRRVEEPSRPAGSAGIPDAASAGTATSSDCWKEDSSRLSLKGGPSGLSSARAQEFTARPTVAGAGIGQARPGTGAGPGTAPGARLSFFVLDG